jgi:hypothetical protein
MLLLLLLRLLLLLLPLLLVLAAACLPPRRLWKRCLSHWGWWVGGGGYERRGQGCQGKKVLLVVEGRRGMETWRVLDNKRLGWEPWRQHAAYSCTI